ncbi:MAG: glycine zipper 2TM domain-containing protein [Fulvimonas sp.]|jgi:uncharacterized protein YcfJ|nr:glycine zipper 2TM domain-containing protein [Fulvimonas sp.]
MNKVMLRVLSLGMAGSCVLGLAACNRDASADPGTASAAAEAAGPKYAKVVSVEPVRETVNTPHEVCHDEVVRHTAPPSDQHQIAGTAIGAVVGGVLGHQIGGGSGRTLATVAGAVGGGYAGKKIQESNQHGTVSTTTRKRCETVTESTTQIVGYDVRYEYNGVTRTVRMDHDPGDRVEIQEGVVAVSDAH